MKCGQSRIDLYTDFLARLLRSGATWVHPEVLGERVGVSRATAYRWLIVAEANGFPIERARRPIEGMTVGVRCALVAKRRGAA